MIRFFFQKCCKSDSQWTERKSRYEVWTCSDIQTGWALWTLHSPLRHSWKHLLCLCEISRVLRGLMKVDNEPCDCYIYNNKYTLLLHAHHPALKLQFCTLKLSVLYGNAFSIFVCVLNVLISDKLTMCVSCQHITAEKQNEINGEPSLSFNRLQEWLPVFQQPWSWKYFSHSF